MAVASAYPLGEPMSWEEYVRRGSDPPSEYIAGRLVMVPQPSRVHQRISRRLANLLDAIVPDDHEVTESWGWKIGMEEYGPDVMVHPVTDEDVRFTGVPLLVVEVLSSNRSRDLARKVQKYAEGGALNYWIIDPRDRRFTAMQLDEDGIYTTGIEVDDESGPAEIPLGDTVFHADIHALLD